MFSYYKLNIFSIIEVNPYFMEVLFLKPYLHQTVFEYERYNSIITTSLLTFPSFSAPSPNCIIYNLLFGFAACLALAWILGVFVTKYLKALVVTGDQSVLATHGVE